ncbi:odorant receptor 42a-like [Scaptodrosophila lebanonensis]|uniref:Odorant receptor n=1 Tax=Drosophila lebanonensis TaxID=7225 RepID=A0A6J2T0P2_DROLE|nr:odorant receptor 42a-like [Scaptodrosophila lebanonensis]
MNVGLVTSAIASKLSTMVLSLLFPAMYTAPDDSPARSRNAALYLRRCVFYMGIRRPPQRFFVIYILWSLALNISSTFYQPIGFMTGVIIHLKEFSAGEFLTSVQVAFNAWSCSVKVIILWVLLKRLDHAADLLDQMDKRVTQPSERRMIHRAVAQSNRVLFLFMSVYMIYATTTFLGAVWNGRPPYQNYYPLLDWRASPCKFWLQASLEYFAMAGACFQDCCVDCYPINFVLPLRVHVNLLADRLRRLGQTTNDNLNSEKRHEQLINCIQDHKLLLRYCDVIGPVISGTIFVQFLVVGVVLGLTLINLVLFANLASGVAALFFLSAVLLETTPFCILCNFLTDDCSKLSDALFESEWMDKEQRYRKTVLFFLHKLQQPITFMAMGVFTISVGTNITVTKFGFSVFTLVKQMNLAERLSTGNREH